MKQDRRGSWYLLTGAVLGAAVGLFYSWVISPVKYVDAPPYALRIDFKDEYRALVAAAYGYSGDLLRAGDRLAQLKDDDAAQSLAMQAQRALAEGRPEAEVQALGILAMALNEGVLPAIPSLTPMQIVTDLPATRTINPTELLVQPVSSITLSPQPSHTPTDIVLTPKPTSSSQPVIPATPTPTQGALFQLNDTRLVCNQDQPQPLIQVEIQDAAGQPVQSIELVVIWDGGEDHFFTGLKPELGLGYADFSMAPYVVYSLRLAEGGKVVNDLIAAECQSEDETRYWGSWMLTFIQP